MENHDDLIWLLPKQLRTLFLNVQQQQKNDDSFVCKF